MTERRPSPDDPRECAVKLTRFAVAARYPGVSEVVTRPEYEEALSLAEKVVQWAEGLLQSP